MYTSKKKRKEKCNKKKKSNYVLKLLATDIFLNLDRVDPDTFFILHLHNMSPWIQSSAKRQNRDVDV